MSFEFTAPFHFVATSFNGRLGSTATALEGVATGTLDAAGVGAGVPRLHERTPARPTRRTFDIIGHEHSAVVYLR